MPPALCLLKKPLTHTSLIPISILRLVSLSQTLKSDNFLFDCVTTEIWTQAELCFAVLSATIPCLRIFLAAAQTGLLDLGATDIGTSAYNTGSRAHKLRSSRIKRSGQGDFNIELTARGHGETISKAVAGRGDSASMASDSSERAIVVRQTVNIQFDQETAHIP